MKKDISRICKYDLFNKYSKDLFKFVIKLEPDNVKIKTIYQSCKLLQSINKKFLHNLYDTIIFIPYEKYILEKNEIYFLDPNFFIIGFETNFIKDSWINLSPDNKDIIWNKLIKLASLNTICKNN